MTLNALLVGDFHGILPSIKKSDRYIDCVIALGDYCSVDAVKERLFKIVLSGREPKIPELRDELDAIKAQVLEEFNRVFGFLNEIGRIYFVFGNADLICFFDEMLDISRDYDAFYVSEKPVKIENFSIVGCDGMPKRGYNTSWIRDEPEIVNDFDDETEFKRLERIFGQINGPIIFVSHVPPYKILDIPSRDDMTLFSELYGEVNAGSKSVRRIIETFHPDFHLSAHTHMGGQYIVEKNGYITNVINVGAAMNNTYTILDTAD